MNQRTVLHLALGLCSLLLAFFSLSPCLDNEFSAADVAVVQQAQTAQRAPEVLQDPWWPGWHRPLAQWFLAWEYHLIGPESGLYRVLQILLHAVNATLVFALFRYPCGTPVAAATSMLFALGFGFYGTTVFAVRSIDQMLALTLVLASGIAAARAQLLRTPRQRVGSMLISAVLFVAALACNEIALMGLIVLGAFMWPNRRTVLSVLRKLALLVVGTLAWFAYQWQLPDPVLSGGAQLGDWLWMPWRVLQLATWTMVPLDTSLVSDTNATLGTRLVGLLDQTRPAYSLVFGGLLIWWLGRGSGALRWLVASWMAFLVPVALWASANTGVVARDVYLAAPFFCGFLAHGLRRLWLRLEQVGRVGVAILVAASFSAELLLVRAVESGHAARGTTAEARAAQARLFRQRSGPEATEPETRGTFVPQKSVPMATLVAARVDRSSGSNNQAQSTLRTKVPRLMRPPRP